MAKIKVMAAKPVYYGKIIRDVNLPGGKLDLCKLYPENSILEIDEEDFTDADKQLPGAGKGVMGSYRRVDASVPVVIPVSAFTTDTVRSVQAQADAILENAKAEAKRILEAAIASAAPTSEKQAEPALPQGARRK